MVLHLLKSLYTVRQTSGIGGYVWAPTPLTINGLWVGVYVARWLYRSRKTEFHIASCSEMLFFPLENWQIRESSLILEIQFNSRNNSVDPIKKPWRCQLVLGHLVMSIRICMWLCHISAPYFYFFKLCGSTLRSVFEFSLTLIMIVRIMGHFGSPASFKGTTWLKHKHLLFPSHPN